MKFILTLTLSLSLFTLSAQEIISKNYFNKKNELIQNVDSAYYSREIIAKDLSGFYKIKEYYLNGKLKSEGMLSNYEPSYIYEGTKTSYYENGNKEIEDNYDKGQQVGDCKSFYQNGNLKEHLVYFNNLVKNPKEDVLTYRTIQVADSLGKTFLDEKGNGIVDMKNKNGYEEYGKYINGFRDGLWKTIVAKDGENHEDIYDNGKYINGKTVRPDGSIQEYNKIFQLPEFKGGLERFGKFLGQNLRYPASARKSGKQGRVFIGFVVERDGTLTDIKVIKGVSSDIDGEAVRVLKLSPKWSPGKQRGREVRVSYTVPIVFQLAR